MSRENNRLQTQTPRDDKPQDNIYKLTESNHLSPKDQNSPPKPKARKSVMNVRDKESTKMIQELEEEKQDK